MYHTVCIPSVQFIVNQDRGRGLFCSVMISCTNRVVVAKLERVNVKETRDHDKCPCSSVVERSTCISED